MSDEEDEEEEVPFHLDYFGRDSVEVEVEVEELEWIGP